MNYDESLSYIQSLSPTLEKPTLKRMQLFLQEENNFQNNIPCFQVGGTNGKGSTVTILDAAIRLLGKDHGIKVGRFTGPHILRWNERLHINGRPISDRDFAEIATIAKEKSLGFAARHADLGPLTWFEFLTAMAFYYFSNERVDCAVLEVGLGGRFDATNVCENVLGTIITNIDLDHTHILGDTVQQIAFEKAGIIKSNAPFFTAASAEALTELKEQARARGAKLELVDQFSLSHITGSPQAEEILGQLSLLGEHQRINASLALVCLSRSRLFDQYDSSDFWKNAGVAMSKIYWPGRAQVIDEQNLIIDGAHNPAGALALRNTLDKSFGRPSIFITGFFSNKDVPAFLENLLRKDDTLIACEADSRRTTYPREKIVELCRAKGVRAITEESITNGLRRAQKMRKADELIVATGSFAVLKEMMLALDWNSVEDAISKRLAEKY